MRILVLRYKCKARLFQIVHRLFRIEINTKKIISKPQENQNGQFDLFATPGSGNVSEEESIRGYKNITTSNICEMGRGYRLNQKQKSYS